MMIMAREASIQLTYQNALLLYQLFYPPLIELDFTNGYDAVFRCLVFLLYIIAASALQRLT